VIEIALTEVLALGEYAFVKKDSPEKLVKEM
jgi:hypothetical protein